MDAMAIVGDLATWATAGVAGVALVFAKRAAKASREAAKASRDMLDLEHERDRAAADQQQQRALREERAEQADDVAVWPKASGHPVLTNGSKLPIYNVVVTFIPKVGDPRETASYEVVGPGERTVANPQGRWVKNETTGLDEPEFDMSHARHEITFTDTAGRTWKRDARGRLRLIKREDFLTLSGVLPNPVSNFQIKNES